ncbi:hypothetical protein K431DRAFT_305721 [Polychaeton citri CBS 116435]|uniref:Galactose oxidase n=1 Tax=Polychaeton citri CBS 116435 TaxID=1314669 RepID=A0A9P4UNC1_9PEZI|nr:hypothetical protein K431DRAFT_305721 [Polychaeton citri CBS 116435]
MSEAAGVAYGLKNIVEGAVLLAKGIYDPTLPLKAKLTTIDDVPVPRSKHTISIVKGRAYIFGGLTGNVDHGEELAENDMNIVVLPSLEGVGSADFKRVQAGSKAPSKRYDHSAAVIEDRIYIFGGRTEEGLLDEACVWVYDTSANGWSRLDVAGEKRPPARGAHASVASEHPRSASRRTDVGSLPQQPPDPATVLPEPDAPDSHGTVLIQGGTGKDGDGLSDMWSFDISSRRWEEFPSHPPPTSKSPSLAMVENRLYTFAHSQVHYLDFTQSSFDDRGGKGELGLAPLGPWSTIPPHSPSEHDRPGERSGATLTPVTTGQGRNYLLLLGGESLAGDQLQDVWALQLKPEGMTAASFKDAARMTVKANTGETQWAEVKYYNQDGVMIQEGQAGRGIGERRGVAASKGTEVDGATVVFWGGVQHNGRFRGDGVMLTVDR